jgi:predicted transcriptional regulator
MSLRPTFAEAIYSGSKRFEFRRVRASINYGERVLVYESAPSSRLTGEFWVGNVVSASPSEVLTLEPNVESRRLAESYLSGARVATAIEVVNPLRWQRHRVLKNLFPNLHPHNLTLLWR